MSTQPVRVLHVFGRLGLGGAETRTVELYRYINREQVQFDFLVHSDNEEYYDKTVEEMGAHIYRVPRFHGSNFLAYRRALKNLFAENRGRWRMVQGHMTSTASIYLPLAKRYGAVKTIAHARSAGTEPGVKTIATRLFEYPLRFQNVADERFAVSADAGKSVFGKRLMQTGRVRVVTNAIDTSRAAFNEDLRERLRAELNVRDCYVVGHAGSFVYAKNHPFLLRVFAEMVKQGKADKRKRKLMLAGDGPEREAVQALAEKLGIADDVLFLGHRRDMNACYSAMDVFVYPSHYEGLPGVVVEAQAAGLPALISDRITTEVMVTPLVKSRSIGEDASIWAEQANEILSNMSDRKKESALALETLRNAGFDVRAQARRMTDFYLGVMDTP